MNIWKYIEKCRYIENLETYGNVNRNTFLYIDIYIYINIENKTYGVIFCLWICFTSRSIRRMGTDHVAEHTSDGDSSHRGA